MKEKIKVLMVCHGNICRSTMAQSVLTHLVNQVGIPVVPHRAVQMTANDYEYYDYLIGMDSANIRNMNRIAGSDPDAKIYKLLTFVDSGRDVADPWYTGDFDATYEDVVAGCEGFLAFLKREGVL